MNKQLKEFLRMIDDMQNRIVNVLMNNRAKIIIVRSSKFTGKTTLVRKLFNTISEKVVYHTGCNPKKIRLIDGYFCKFLTQEEYLNVILDEYIGKKSLKLLLNKKNIRIFIFTNRYNLKINNAKYFNLDCVYEDFKKHFFKENYNFWEGKNIRDIVYLLNKENELSEHDFINYSNEMERLRHVSLISKIYYKNSDISEISFDMGDKNDISIIHRKI